MNYSKKHRKIAIQKFYLDIWIKYRGNLLVDEYQSWQVIKGFFER